MGEDEPVQGGFRKIQQGRPGQGGPRVAGPRPLGIPSLHDEFMELREQFQEEHRRALEEGLQFDPEVEYPSRLLAWAEAKLETDPENEQLQAIAESARKVLETYAEYLEALNDMPSEQWLPPMKDMMAKNRWGGRLA